MYLIPEEEDIERIREMMLRGGHTPANVKRATKEAWSSIRVRVFARDGGTCHLCGCLVPFEYYECGHIIDRCRDGSDRDSNLVVMCNVCNRLKPVHTTRAGYLDWVALVREEGVVQACAILRSMEAA